MQRSLRDATAALDKARHAAVNWLRAHPRASDRELTALTLVAQGKPTDVIAQELGVSPETVRSCLRDLSRRWGCRGRAQLVATAFKLGYFKIREGAA